MRKRTEGHSYTKISSKASRKTAFNCGRCSLLPGGIGQLVAQACRLGGPYLLLWSYTGQVEGATAAEMMGVLRQLGFVPAFLWKLAGSRGGQRVHPVRTTLARATFTLY